MEKRMHTRRLPLAALLLASVCVSYAQTGWSQVYKCNEGGVTSFSDQPCVNGDVETMNLEKDNGPRGSIDFTVSVTHYRITGNNVREAYTALRKRNPNGFAGWARWNVDFQYMPEVVESNCRIAEVTVRIAGEILMPEWIGEASAASADQAEWRRMYAQLKRHEDGHIQHGREFALLLKERLMGIGTVQCKQLQSRSVEEYQQLFTNLQFRDQEYDRRTDHGLR
jgi:predicted secreted Zn-dependent protease